MSEEPFWEISGPRKYLHIPVESPDYWRAEITYGSFPNYKRAVGWGATEEAAKASALRAADMELSDDANARLAAIDANRASARIVV